MDGALDLSNLHELLYSTLLITEEIIEVLKKNCDEAIFALKPWRIKAITIEREDENICNCKETANEKEIEDIAADINKALVLAQEFREKVKYNVTLQKRRLKKNPMENIYSAARTSDKNQQKISKKNIAMQVTGRDTESKKLTVPSNDKITPITLRKSMTSVNDIKQGNAINKIQSKTMTTKVGSKSNKEKNFIRENKLNIKKINKCKVNNSDSNDTPGNSKVKNSPSSITSTTELNTLIHKITQRPTQNTILTSYTESNKNNCPLHGDNIRQFIREHNAPIDVIEALQQFNVPNEIVKVLRIYHAFLKTELTGNLKETIKEKCKKSTDIFLKEFNVMNTATQNYLQEPHLVNIATQSISLFKNTFNENLNVIQLNNIKKTCSELQTSLKQYNGNNVKSIIIERPFCKFSFAKGWTSNGIWNISCMEYFKNFSKSYSVRYYNKKQLLMLHEVIQKLQHTKYLDTLIQIILHNIIPTMKSNIDPTSMEYARAYKMILILYQGLNPEIPVLVKTDN